MCNEWKDNNIVDRSRKIIELRESTGMNRREFCEYFDIPYRTVTEWERDNRHAPEYVLRLLEYYIRAENLMLDRKAGQTDEQEEYDSCKRESSGGEQG